MRLSSFTPAHMSTLRKDQPQFGIGLPGLGGGSLDPVQQLPWEQQQQARELEPVFIALAKKHNLLHDSGKVGWMPEHGITA
jgi:hypothetical protein